MLHEKIKILIAEDNPVNQKVTSFPFIKRGITPDIAENGKLAINLYKQKRHEVVLMDIHMPEVDGVEATKEIRKFEKENNIKAAKIIAVTANILLEERELYLSYGLDEIVPKPVDFKTLQDVIEKLLKK